MRETKYFVNGLFEAGLLREEKLPIDKINATATYFFFTRDYFDLLLHISLIREKKLIVV
jgi:hypothetical protein